jgi:hypothetical protein
LLIGIGEGRGSLLGESLVIEARTGAFGMILAVFFMLLNVLFGLSMLVPIIARSLCAGLL